MRIREFIEEVKRGNIDVAEHTSKILEEAEKINKEYNYFNTISKDLALKQAKSFNKKGKLAGVPISVKDNICVKDIETTAGSKILRGYKPVFNATVIQKCIDEGAIIIGKTAQDEFGFGGFSVNVGINFKIPLNPFDKERATGGSSGGAAGFTQKTKYNHIALGQSTGGSIAAPASFCGVAGLCPTYGVVSRYGLIDYSNSMDKIGSLGKSVDDAEVLFDIIKGHDKMDATSLNKELNKDDKVKRIGIIKETLNVDKDIRKIIDQAINKVDNVEEISLPLNEKYGVATYYLIAMAEASTNLAKFCGMRYGKHEKLEGSFNDYFSKVRSANFGQEAKRRIILGTFTRMAGYRDAYYIKAMQVRTKLIEEYKKAFKKYDVLISPTMPIVAPKFNEIAKLTPLQNYMMDIMTVGPNLAGLPHLSVNVGNYKNLPVGIMIIGDHLNEKKIINVGRRLE